VIIYETHTNEVEVDLGISKKKPGFVWRKKGCFSWKTNTATYNACLSFARERSWPFIPDFLYLHPFPPKASGGLSQLLLMNAWILKGRTPEKASLFRRIVGIAKTKQWGEILKEENFKTSRGDVKVATCLLALTWGEDPRFESTATGPGVPIDLIHKPFETKSYKEALSQHDRLVLNLKTRV